MRSGFVMHQAGVTTGVCPVCNTALSGRDINEVGSAMVRHFNFTHDAPPNEEDF